jgi:hypothetical protein
MMRKSLLLGASILAFASSALAELPAAGAYVTTAVKHVHPVTTAQPQARPTATTEAQ